MLHAVTGISNGSDSYGVAVEAAATAQKKLHSTYKDAPQLAIVLASVEYEQKSVIKGIRSVIGDTVKIVGASTAGEITEDGPAGRHSVALMLLASDTMHFYTGVGPSVAEDPQAAGATMAEQIQKEAGGDELKLVIMFPDVLVGNGTDVVRGVLSKVGEHLPVVGGAAGDDFRFQKTYQYFDDTVHTGAVVGIGFSGDVHFGVGVKHGWLPIGIPMEATKSEGSVLHELDGMPAISVYEDHFGTDVVEELKNDVLAKLAISYPLGIHMEGSEEMLIRDPLTVDEKGSITCAAEVPEGSEIRLMVGHRNEAIKAAREASQKVVRDIENKEPKAVLIFNCVARKKLLAEYSSEEIRVIQENVGNEVPLLGFYTYGEQAPLEGEIHDKEKCNPSFHNETVVVVALAD